MMHTKGQLNANIISSFVAAFLCGLAASPCEASNIWDGDLEAPRELSKVVFKDEFRTINKLLSERVSSDDIDANLNKAAEILSKRQSARYFSAIPNRMINALELFVSLKELELGTKCNMKSYRILLQNDRSAKSKAHQEIGESELDSLSRVQGIIHTLSKEHADSCWFRYPKFFKKKLEELQQKDLDILGTVSSALDGYIESEIQRGHMSLSEKIYERFIFQSEAMGAWNFPLAMYESTPNIPIHQQTNQLIPWLSKQGIRRKQFKKIFRDRIVKPCRHYVVLFKDIFIPARYDAVFQKPNDEDEEFYMAWARFRLCNSLIDLDQDKLAKEVDAIYKQRHGS